MRKFRLKKGSIDDKSWRIEEKKWYGWVDYYRDTGYYCGGEYARLTYPLAKKRLEYIMSREAFMPIIVYPPLPEKEPT